MSTAFTDYDLVPYQSRCCHQAHPDHLATLAMLFGMTPAPVDQCRVLELGCGGGTNLLALAHALPNSRFVGVDLATKAIARASDDARGLGLTNVAFHCADLLDWTPSGNSFDYVIAHGVYSWVPESVRLRLLELCRDWLAPQGVVYVSYNVLPGYQLRGMLREFMRLHTRQIQEPAQKIRQARELLRLLLAGQTGQTPYTAWIREEAVRIIDRDADAFVFHDALAEINRPCYFHEFASLAEQYGLQYLGEADFSEMPEAGQPAPIAAAIKELHGDTIMTEQFLDFVVGRRFRQTLLCHADVPLNRSLEAEVIHRFLLASDAQLKSGRPAFSPGEVVTFSRSDGPTMRVDDPLTTAAMLELQAAWPRALPFAELVTAARSRLGAAALHNRAGEAETLARCMTDAYAGAMVQLHIYQPAWKVVRHIRPVLSPLVRWQLTQGSPIVSSLWHTNTHIEAGVAREMLLLLDGSRHLPAVAAELGRRIDAGELAMPASYVRDNLPADVEKAVHAAVADALLIAWDELALRQG